MARLPVSGLFGFFFAGDCKQMAKYTVWEFWDNYSYDVLITNHLLLKL